MLPITDDTWIYDADLDRWQRLAPERHGRLPGPRCHHTLVSDSGTDRILLFGGFSHAGRFNDVWRFDPIAEQWMELEPSGPAPAPRCLHAAAYDPVRDEMLVYGGIHGAGISEQDFFDDTYILNMADNEWTRVDTAGPGKRSGAVAFYSTTEDAVFLWGGKRVSEFPNDLWRFDLDARTWSAVATTGELPLGREDPAWFWDDANQRFLMYSGRNELRAPPLLGDAFELDVSTHTWRRLDIGDAPPPRWRSSVVWDGETGNGIMFGGWRDFGGGNSFNDTWRFDSITLRWTPRAPESR